MAEGRKVVQARRGLVRFRCRDEYRGEGTEETPLGLVESFTLGLESQGGDPLSQ